MKFLVDANLSPQVAARSTPVEARAVAHLLPAARAARAMLAAKGRSLSRDALADAMRDLLTELPVLCPAC